MLLCLRGFCQSMRLPMQLFFLSYSIPVQLG